jgi:pectinesterase
MYSAGKSRGCGGNGIWEAGKLYTTANFVDSKVLANGPIRVMFELTYPAFDAAGGRVTEIKRITLDAGRNLNRFESRYAGAPAAPRTQAAGIKKSPGSQVAHDKARGLLRTWEPVKTDGSNFGCGVIVDPGTVVDVVEADGNVLIITGMSPGSDATYYAGSAWDKSGDFKTVEDWTATSTRPRSGSDRRSRSRWQPGRPGVHGLARVDRLAASERCR